MYKSRNFVKPFKHLKRAVIHEETNGDFIVVTVIYSSELKDVVNRRRGSGRWI